MLNKLLIGLTAVMTTVSASAGGPGLGGSLSQSGVTNAKNIVTPYIFKYLTNLTLPDMSASGANFTNIKVTAPEPSTLDDINLKFNADNSVELAVQDAALYLTADFSYHAFIIGTITGAADINVTKAGVDFTIGLGQQAGTPSYEKAPKLSANKVDVTVDPNDIDIKLTGDLVSKIAGILIPLIKNQIIPSVIADAQDKIKDVIDTTINQDLQQYGTQVTVPYLAGVTLDYAQMGDSPKISSANTLTIALNGTNFDSDDVEKSAYVPADFDPSDLKGKALQLYFSDYVLNTVMEAGFATGSSLDITYLLKKYLNVTVTTDNAGLIVPEILTKYGKGKPVSLSGKWITAASTNHIDTTGMSFDLSLEVTLGVDSDKAIVAPLSHSTIHLDAHTTGGKITGKVANTLGTMGAGFATTLGMTAEQLTADLQKLSDEWVGKLNALLAAGIVIPKIAGIDISDVDLEENKGYISFGATVTPPAFWEYVADFLSFAKEEIRSISEMTTPMPEFIIEEEIIFIE